MNHATHWGLWPTGQSDAVWVLVSWAKMVPPAARKQSIRCFDQHSTSATHVSNTTPHDTKNTHMHTRKQHTHTHAQYNMHNFTNDSQTQEHVQYKGSEADNRAATWWNQTLQMRAAEDVQTCRQGEIERQTDREVCRYKKKKRKVGKIRAGLQTTVRNTKRRK